MYLLISVVTLQWDLGSASLPKVTSQGSAHQSPPAKPATAEEKGKVSCLPGWLAGRHLACSCLVVPAGTAGLVPVTHW